MRQSFRPVLLAAAAALLASVSVQAEPVTYTMDPGHTNVVVSWDHFGLAQPSAMFNQVDGTITYDPENVAASSVQFSLPVSSVHTASEHLDQHLQNADFFDAEKYPTIRFQSTKVVVGDAPNKLMVTGDLTIHGVTKPITLDVTLNKVGERQGAKAIAFNAKSHLKRSSWGVGLYVPMVSDRIDIVATTGAIESAAWDKMHAPKESKADTEDRADGNADSSKADK